MDDVYVDTLRKLIGNCGLTVRDIMVVRKSDFDLKDGTIRFVSPKTHQYRTATILPKDKEWFEFFLGCNSEGLYSDWTERTVWETLKKNNISSIHLRRLHQDTMEEIGASQHVVHYKLGYLISENVNETVLLLKLQAFEQKYFSGDLVCHQ